MERRKKAYYTYISDAGAHGLDYTSNDKYPDQGKLLDKYLSEALNKNIEIAAFKIGDGPEKSFSRVKNLYNNHNFHVEEFDQNNKESGYFTRLVYETIVKIT